LEYLSILQGKWRRSDLSGLVLGLSREEAKELCIWLRNGSHKEDFIAIHQRAVYGSVGSVDYGYHRLTADGISPLLYRLLWSALTGSRLAHSPEWMWPKGRLDRHDESGQRCALRELFEEAQVVIDPEDLHGEPLAERWYGTDGLLYEVRCWVHVVDNDVDSDSSDSDSDNDVEAIDVVDVTEPLGPREIGDKAWLTTDEVEEKAKPWSIRLMRRCQELLSQRTATTT
jgi:8-oxo-dGTP pyrophosphatase MutT (NUDIX family)